MKRYYLFGLVLCMMMPAWGFAQSASKSEKVIYELAGSGMLDTYRDYRRQTETDVALFKTRMNEHSAEDWVRIKAAYEETAEAFEDYLFDVRNDLLDGKKRREIHKETESYARTRLMELDEIYAEYYQGRFYPLYAQINQIDISTASSQRTASADGPIWAVLITPITLATTKIVDFVDDRKEKKLEEFKKTLDKEWIEPNRFRRWDEI